MSTRERRKDPHLRDDADAASPELEAAIRDHVTRVLAVARRILRSDELAEDAVQEAFVSLWRERPETDRQSAWLVRTVIHRSLHARRTAQRRRHWELRAGLEAETDPPCRLCEAERERMNADLRSEIGRALSALDDERRAVFELREIEGLDYAEIAERLAIPVGTVRSRLHRARLALQAALRDWS